MMFKMRRITKKYLLENSLKSTLKHKTDYIATKNNSKAIITKTSLGLATTLLTSITLLSPLAIKPAQSAEGPYCQFIPEEVEAKEKLLKASLKEDPNATTEYNAIVQKHTQMLQVCRSQTWPSEQAIWLRLYPCDISKGSLDYVLDRIVNLGYNKIHLEVFYDSQVLLPPGDNPTPWTPVVRSPGGENIDLLQQTIDKAHQRGIKVYAWLFTMNFGYTYAQRPDRQDALARNGTGQNSLTFVHDRAQAFVDPYSPQAQADYYNLVQAVLKRKPDGILFDYVRYPRGTGGNSSVSNVRNLWIYGKSSLNALYNRASNQKGLALIKKYTDTGNITLQDLKALNQQYPKDGQPQWQGSRKIDSKATIESTYSNLKQDLWFFSVAHAAQGVIDFLSMAAKPAQNLGLPAGAVFFPEANRLVGKSGFDSRLQAWDKFPANLEWHPMAYAVCGESSDCIVDQVNTVLQSAAQNTTVVPALAGAWGKVYRAHPSLEDQMEALREMNPQINSVSHFSYSWQEPDLDRQRQSCNFL